MSRERLAEIRELRVSSAASAGAQAARNLLEQMQALYTDEISERKRGIVGNCRRHDGILLCVTTGINGLFVSATVKKIHGSSQWAYGCHIGEIHRPPERN
ncbi:hypothetical protein QFZ91_005481 [Paraburkholderia sp. JPY419]